jgi:hypothetical protein
MKHFGEKTEWGVYVKYFDRSEAKYWYPSKRARRKALNSFMQQCGPDKTIWTAKECSE